MDEQATKTASGRAKGSSMVYRWFRRLPRAPKPCRNWWCVFPLEVPVRLQMLLRNLGQARPQVEVQDFQLTSISLTMAWCA